MAVNTGELNPRTPQEYNYRYDDNGDKICDVKVPDGRKGWKVKHVGVKPGK